MAPSPLLRTFVLRLLGERRATRRGGRRQCDQEPLRGWYPALLLGLSIAAADWITKAAVTVAVPLEEFRLFLGDRVALWHVRNDAMMLGLWGNLPLGTRKGIAVCAAVMTLLLLLQIVGRGHRLRPHERPWAWAFVGLVLGGMLGNLGERALHWGVTDFLSIRWGDIWLPPGNLADVALFLSIPLALPVALFETLGRARRRPEGVAAPAPVVVEPVAGAADVA